MKYFIKILFLLLSMISFNAHAVGESIGSAFSYQGELIDNGSPANGEYNIRIALMLTEFAGPLAVTFKDFPNVTVVNGLFNIPEVDFGDTVYDGAGYWLLILVKDSDDPGFHVALEPRQRLSAVPYAVQAEFLAANGASNGDVLQFDGNDWVGQAIAPSPWTITGAQISYSTGKVGIGTSNPNATLHISSDASDDPLRIQIGSATKFVVKNNGGMSIGVNGSPPTNGLYVHGDAKQNSSANGLIKYMVYVYCSNGNGTGGGFATPATINRSINNVNSADITISNGPNPAECIIHLPTNISQRYWTTSITGGEINRGSHCKLNTNSSLKCYGVKLSNGNRAIVNMMVLVY